MRKLIVLFSISVCFVACDKDDGDDGNHEVPLTITATHTPGSVQKGSAIVAEVRCSGTDLCYKFSRFEIKETISGQFEVRAKAMYPKKPAACPQAIYTVDTTLSIGTTTTGQHIIHFYNEGLLFKSDTIVVN